MPRSCDSQAGAGVRGTSPATRCQPGVGHRVHGPLRAVRVRDRIGRSAMPKLSVMTKSETRYTQPTGRRTGTRNQSVAEGQRELGHAHAHRSVTPASGAREIGRCRPRTPSSVGGHAGDSAPASDGATRPRTSVAPVRRGSDGGRPEVLPVDMAVVYSPASSACRPPSMRMRIPRRLRCTTYGPRRLRRARHQPGEPDREQWPWRRRVGTPSAKLAGRLASLPAPSTSGRSSSASAIASMVLESSSVGPQEARADGGRIMGASSTSG